MPALLMVAHFDASGQPLRQLEKRLFGHWVGVMK